MVFNELINLLYRKKHYHGDIVLLNVTNVIHYNYVKYIIYTTFKTLFLMLMY